MNEAVKTKVELHSNPGIYESYFGFTENPFNLTPDPKYLFLSQKHKEALAHLSYAVQERKGFVAIFGEVGTGKTTLCRAFLDMLSDEDYEVALIYNPALTSLELLRAINTEFKIDATKDSNRTLIQELNHFLLKASGQGKNVVLIIDEAQDLDPSVLEQLRLISNLETDTRKLMQIVLIGQLELEDILRQRKLRQLDQRIVVRSHLRPFGLHETAKYIEHRLRIASGSNEIEKLFTRAAYQAIHRYTKGIPRLINILADRALIVAYTLNKKKVTRKIVRKAIADLGEIDRRVVRERFVKQITAMVGILVLLTIGWQLRDRINDTFLMVLGKAQNSKLSSKQVIPKGKLQTEVTSAQNIPVETVTSQEASAVVSSNLNPLLETLTALSAKETKLRAVRVIINMWGLSTAVDPSLKFNTIASDLGMRMYQYDGNLSGIRALNYPAILELRLPEEMKAKYIALKHIKGDQGTFSLGNDMNLPLLTTDRFWYGRAYIFWKDFEELATCIEYGDHTAEVAWIQKKLKSLGYYDSDITSIYGKKTKMAVADFQRNHHIRVDGIVGPETKMVLYSRLPSYETPHLVLAVEEEST
ncbi:MAG TPA: AAA family ATPase [Syntrophaceae bacterium]|nr:AAA family ATPase [Syntrophaceae bacterium]